MAATAAKTPRTIPNSVLKTPQMNLNITVNVLWRMPTALRAGGFAGLILEARGADTLLSYTSKVSENK